MSAFSRSNALGRAILLLQFQTDLYCTDHSRIRQAFRSGAAWKLRVGSTANRSGANESAIIIEQPPGTWKVVSIVWYKNDRGEEVNGVHGNQTIYIPLTDFIGWDQHGNVDNSHLNLEAPAGPIHVRFWNANDFLVEIDSIVACNSQPGK